MKMEVGYTPPHYSLGITFILLARIVEAVLKRLCKMICTLKHGSQTHSKGINHFYSNTNNVVKANVSVFLLKNS